MTFRICVSSLSLDWGAIHTSELDRSEIDLIPKRSECERSNVNWDRSKIDLNECEHFLKANWDRSQIDPNLDRSKCPYKNSTWTCSKITCDDMWTRVSTCVITCDHMWFWNIFMWNFWKGVKKVPKLWCGNGDPRTVLWRHQVWRRNG